MYAMYRGTCCDVIATYTICNPLIALLIIGDYQTSHLPNLKYVKQDYQNIIYAFNHIRGYDIAYNNEQNKLEHINHQISDKNILTF